MKNEKKKKKKYHTVGIVPKSNREIDNTKIHDHTLFRLVQAL